MKVRLKAGGRLGLSSPRMSIDPGQIVHLPREIVERWAGRFDILDETNEDLDIEQFHIGYGWYELPNHAQKVRKEQALVILGKTE